MLALLMYQARDVFTEVTLLHRKYCRVDHTVPVQIFTEHDSVPSNAPGARGAKTKDFGSPSDVQASKSLPYSSESALIAGSTRSRI